MNAGWRERYQAGFGLSTDDTCQVVSDRIPSRMLTRPPVLAGASLLLVLLGYGCVRNPYPNNLMPLMLKQDSAMAARIAKCQRAGATITAGVRDDGVLIITIQAPPDKFKQLQADCFRELQVPGLSTSIEFR